jgi:hypothetical protein
VILKPSRQGLSSRAFVRLLSIATISRWRFAAGLLVGVVLSSASQRFPEFQKKETESPPMQLSTKTPRDFCPMTEPRKLSPYQAKALRAMQAAPLRRVPRSEGWLGHAGELHALCIITSLEKRGLAKVADDRMSVRITKAGGKRVAEAPAEAA